METINSLKNYLFTAVFLFCSTLSFSQCDFDFTYANTGSSMTVFFTPTAASAMVAEMGEGTIGAFFLDDS